MYTWQTPIHFCEGMAANCVRSIHTFVAACLAGDEPEWSTEQLPKLADDNRVYRASVKADPLPKVINAALAAATQTPQHLHRRHSWGAPAAGPVRCHP
jgi:hypothetical protein